jgi:predicted nucleotide-binding protein (sugar kinase/HSP70/actin superfamily)
MYTENDTIIFEDTINEIGIDEFYESVEKFLKYGKYKRTFTMKNLEFMYKREYWECNNVFVMKYESSAWDKEHNQ